MHHILTIGIDLISAVLILFPIVSVFLFFSHPRSLKWTALSTLFLLYLCAVFSAVGFPSICTLTFDPSIHWLPLVDVFSDPISYLKNSALNILLFIPLGILLPILWGDHRSAKNILAWGFGLSLTIECLQLFTLRLTDVDDLLMNSLGAILGYYLSKVLLTPAQPTENPVHSRRYRRPLALLALALLLMFTIQPLLSSAIWEVLLDSPLWESIR